MIFSLTLQTPLPHEEMIPKPITDPLQNKKSDPATTRSRQISTTSNSKNKNSDIISPNNKQAASNTKSTDAASERKSPKNAKDRRDIENGSPFGLPGSLERSNSDQVLTVE